MKPGEERTPKNTIGQPTSTRKRTNAPALSQKQDPQQPVPTILFRSSSTASGKDILGSSVASMTGGSWATTTAAATTGGTSSTAASQEFVWNVSDTSVPSIPPWHEPLMIPQNCATITDVPPSILARRLTSAIRYLNVIVEYNEETSVAQLYTMDHTHFSLHLWKHKNLFVEAVFLSGNLRTFHRMKHVLLMAAQSLHNGKLCDDPPNGEASLLLTEATESDPSSDLITSEIEQISELMTKDRWEVQRHAMTSLFHLTQSNPLLWKSDKSNGLASSLQSWILYHDNNDKKTEGTVDKDDDEAFTYHARHVRFMRLKALQIFSLILQQDDCLKIAWVGEKRLQTSLWNDVKLGMERPLIMVLQTDLPGVHECIVALRCLRLLHRFRDQEQLFEASSNHVILERLRQIGRLSNDVLEKEAELAYDVFTVDDRTC